MLVIIALLILALLVAYFIYFFIEDERLKKEIFELQLKIEKLEVFKRKPFFKSNNTNLYWEIYDLKSRAEMLGFCSQCPLYQEKAQEYMQKTLQQDTK